MNASALLTAQGWRGKGHSLHKTDDTVGLSKPLLLNRKDNTKGIGATQHFTSDQWWMNAFDEQLQGLDTSKKGKVVQTITTGKLNAIEKGSLGKYSLYTTFVRGGFLEGTIAALNRRKDSSSSESATELDSDAAAKKVKKAALRAGESKEARRARKEAKRRRREDKAQRKLERKSKKSRSKSDSSDDAAKEKRRRRARKEEKRRRRKEEEGK